MQRRRGQTARVFKTTKKVNNRGNTVRVPGEEYMEVNAAFIPQRGAKAEVPGQQIINVVRMIVSHELPNVDLWSRVEYDGKVWDVVTPPSYHHGSRHTRHWSLDLRERP